jgi:DNA replication and repair protein RecF
LRRRFLDLEISQISPGYVHAFAHYRRVLEQRNRLLKAMREGGSRGLEESLVIWDEQLLEHGARMVERRRQFARHLEELARPIHGQLTEAGEALSLAYECSFPLPEAEGLEAIRPAFAAALREARAEETRRAVSLVGPHRDDLVFRINDLDVRTYGSQGQQRTAALSTRLAEVELVREVTEEPPVCLLDDVLSELDDLAPDRCPRPSWSRRGCSPWRPVRWLRWTEVPVFNRDAQDAQDGREDPCPSGHPVHPC